MGKSADFKDTIFDAFTRAESSLTNKIQGTGLGMAITKNLVEAIDVYKRQTGSSVSTLPS